MRSEAVEAIKATPPVGYFVGMLAGVDWGTIASFLACMYTAWLLGEKIWRAVSPRVKAWRAKRQA